MAQNIAVETLLKERQRLIDERDRITREFDFQIEEIQTSVERINGKTVWTADPAMVYDDQSPDYIKGSIEN